MTAIFPFMVRITTKCDTYTSHKGRPFGTIDEAIFYALLHSTGDTKVSIVVNVRVTANGKTHWIRVAEFVKTPTVGDLSVDLSRWPVALVMTQIGMDILRKEIKHG